MKKPPPEQSAGMKKPPPEQSAGMKKPPPEQSAGMNPPPPEQSAEGNARKQFDRKQLMSAAALIQLEARVRHAASGEALGFLIVNETHQLVPYRVSAFWLARGNLKLRREMPQVDAKKGAEGQPDLAAMLSPEIAAEKKPGPLTAMVHACAELIGHGLRWLKDRMVGGLRRVKRGLIWCLEKIPGVARYRSRRWLSSGKIIALSGVAKVDREAPAAQWLERLMNHLVIHAPALRPTPVSASDVPPDIAESWGEWLPPYGIISELRNRDGYVIGSLLLTREEPWDEKETNILNHVLDCYAHALDALIAGGKSYFPRPRMGAGLAYSTIALLVGAMFIPVDLSVLAPSEIVAANPVVVSSPLQGVIASVDVKPNQAVGKDELLLKLDDRDLRNRLAVSSAALDIAQTEYEQSLKQSLVDERARPQVAILRGKAKQFKIERDYISNMLSRVDILAPGAGVAIFEDPNDLIGVPVEQGQRLMTIANADDIKVRIYLPVSESLSFDIGAQVRLFLNIDPDRPIDGEVTYIGYRAQPQDQQGLFAYRIDANIRPQNMTEKLRIGLKGTAKIYSEKVTLFYYLFRRPLAALRQKVGF